MFGVNKVVVRFLTLPVQLPRTTSVSRLGEAVEAILGSKFRRFEDRTNHEVVLFTTPAGTEGAIPLFGRRSDSRMLKVGEISVFVNELAQHLNMDRKDVIDGMFQYQYTECILGGRRGTPDQSFARFTSMFTCTSCLARCLQRASPGFVLKSRSCFPLWAVFRDLSITFVCPDNHRAQAKV